ncbi:hypothetical protein HF325_001612 [Metschnikowia pulcherrima]|uniref:Protein DSF2 n=1 Tax=Metschnikowia pulcherrima TaxID=27326 RepID=A0A8H7GUX8_9ASCO|nr:hypothetical protein HF325_001612 [Metschnikowia pulcherrima]
MSHNGHTTPAATHGAHALSWHRLQAHLARDRELSFAQTLPSSGNLLEREREGESRARIADDNDSIYSFDSVSTSCRLLDRLDLDAEDYNDYDATLRRRESAALLMSIGRSWELPSDELAQALSTDLRLIPIRANSSLGLDRMRSLNRNTVGRTPSQNNRAPTQAVPSSFVQPKKNRSFDSLHADIASRQNSSSSLSSTGDSSQSHMLASSSRPNNLRSTNKLATYSPIPESASEFASPSQPIPGKSPLVTRVNTAELGSSLNTKASDSPFLAETGSSSESLMSIMNVSSNFDASVETSLKRALAIRAQGNHREASYQLQIIANAPCNYPRAMLLASKWLCRCILTSHIAEKSPPSSQSFISYISKLASLLPEMLLEMVKMNLGSGNYDPFTLIDYFQAQKQTTKAKLITLNDSDKNYVATAYFLLAQSLIKGQGVKLKDEVTARLFLGKSASLGYGESMALLGELWCSKTKHFKKDYHIASAWLRMGEDLGKLDIGNSWIYKSKYMEQKKK